MRGDKFARPTNGYQQKRHDEIAAETGKRAAPCPGCGAWRWFEPETLQMPEYLCDTCVIDGPPKARPYDLDLEGGLTQRQRAKGGPGRRRR